MTWLRIRYNRLRYWFTNLGVKRIQRWADRDVFLCDQWDAAYRDRDWEACAHLRVQIQHNHKLLS